MVYTRKIENIILDVNNIVIAALTPIFTTLTYIVDALTSITPFVCCFCILHQLELMRHIREMAHESKSRPADPPI